MIWFARLVSFVCIFGWVYTKRNSKYFSNLRSLNAHTLHPISTGMLLLDMSISQHSLGGLNSVDPNQAQGVHWLKMSVMQSCQFIITCLFSQNFSMRICGKWNQNDSGRSGVSGWSPAAKFPRPVCLSVCLSRLCGPAVTLCVSCLFGFALCRHDFSIMKCHLSVKTGLINYILFKCVCVSAYLCVRVTPQSVTAGLRCHTISFLSIPSGPTL